MGVATRTKQSMARLWLAAAVLWPAAARAATPDELVAKGAAAVFAEADAKHTDFRNQIIRVRIETGKGDSTQRTIEIRTITTADGRRAIRFLAPPDLKGMAVLIRARDEIYVRLPDSPRIRRVAAHARNQTFQGTDWTFDDMATVAFSADYEATDIEAKGDHVVIDARRKASSSLPWPRLRLWVEARRVIIDKIEYLDDAGKPTRVQDRRDYRKVDGKHGVHFQVLLRNVRTGHWTRNTVLDAAFDQDVPASTFKKRWLIRGH